MLVESININATKPTVDSVPDIGSVLKNQASQGQELRRDRKNGKQDEDVEFLKDVLEVAQNHLNVSGVNLAFSVHEDTGIVQVDVTDKETGDIIREIPSEQVLNLMAKIDEMMGIIFDERA